MEDIAQPLKIYTSAEYQLKKLQDLRKYRNYPSLVVNRQHLIPFVIRRFKETPTIADYYDITEFTAIEAQNIDIPSKVYDIRPNLTFNFGVQSRPVGATEYAFYNGESTIPALPQGRYQLYFKDEDNNELYSEVFAIRFPDYTCKFEFTNSKIINHLWHYQNKPFIIELETTCYSTNEFDEVVKLVYDVNEHEKKTWQRKDEILAIDCIIDSTVFAAIHAMAMCDSIYFTNQFGYREKIRIMEIALNDSTNVGHVNATIRFSIIQNMMSSLAQGTIQWIGSVQGTDPPVYTKETQLTIGGKYVTIGGKRVKLR